MVDKKIVFDKNKVWKFDTYNELIEFFVDNRDSKYLNNWYCETHHIVPKSEGGPNSEDNLVSLPYRYHIQAHWLRAIELYSLGDKKASWDNFRSVGMLLSCVNGNRNLYNREQIKEFLDNVEFQNVLEEYKKKVLEQYAINNSGENNPMYGKQRPQWLKDKLRKLRTGSKLSQETIRKITEKNSIKVHQYLIDGTYLYTYKSISSAGICTGIPYQNINGVLSGSRKAAGGFYWSKEIGDGVELQVIDHVWGGDEKYNELKSIARKMRHKEFVGNLNTSEKTKRKIVHVFDMGGIYIHSFKSISNAKIYYGVNGGDISCVLSGKRNSCRNRKFSTTLPENIVPVFEEVERQYKDVRENFGDRVIHKFSMGNEYIGTYRSMAEAAADISCAYKSVCDVVYNNMGSIKGFKLYDDIDSDIEIKYIVGGR